MTRPGGIAVDGSGSRATSPTRSPTASSRLGPDGAYLGQSGYIADRTGFAAPNTGPGQFNRPGAVAYDPRDGTLWVADTANDRIQHLTLDGAPIATYGSAGTAVGQLRDPQAAAVDPAGGVLVADTVNDRVIRLAPATGAWTPLDTGGTALTRPQGVAASAAGTVYVADRAPTASSR